MLKGRERFNQRRLDSINQLHSYSDEPSVVTVTFWRSERSKTSEIDLRLVTATGLVVFDASAATANTKRCEVKISP